MDQISNRLLRAMKLTYDFYNFIPEGSLKLDIPNAPSNTIGQQVWCIIGARESYLTALEEGSWPGFSCSLHNPLDKSLVLGTLEESALNIQLFCQGAGPDTNWDLVLDLLEHEVQHHGQLIRFSYSNKLGFPTSWNKRYTVG